MKERKFIVGKGRSLVTARRGMAHEGAIVTPVDITGDKPEEVIAAFLKSGRLVEVEKGGPAKTAPPKTTGKTASKTPVLTEDATAEEVEAAIKGLDKNNKDLWTLGNVPQVSALEAAIGKRVTADLRTSVWSKMQGL